MSDGTSPEAAEYARLQAEAAQAARQQQDLYKNHPDRSDTEACAAHKALIDAAIEAREDASDAADAYLREHPEVLPVYDAALRWLALGIGTLPVKKDGSKAPDCEWKQYIERLPTDDELWAWHHRGGTGLGLTTGRTDREDGLSLEMFEFEARALAEGVHKEFLGYIAEAGLDECWARIMAGYWEISPSEGIHAYWLAPDVCGNTKLAQRLATPEELAEKPGDKYRTLIETRGLGGFSVAAPTPGSFHPSGRPWLGDGSPEITSLITAEEREGIFACARKCHKVPKGAIHERPERAKHETLERPSRSPDAPDGDIAAGTRPGDIYNQYGPDWAELLEPHGWRQAGEGADGEIRWTRPGKAGGPSATTGNTQHEGDKFHCFTSSTEFEPDESYSRFAVYAILNHEGDFAAAAAQLRADGYVSEEEAADSDDLKRPDVYPAIRAFEQLYDLRKSGEGFFARPRDPDTPAVVIEIGDDLEYAVMLWWRAQADAWNAKVHRGAIEATDAWKAELEAQDPLVQLEVLKNIVYDDRAKKDDGESESGTDPVPRVDTFSRIMKHLKASATQHAPVELHLRVVDGPGYVALDLADESGSVVLITESGWSLCDVREVDGVPWFRRNDVMLSQVLPVQPEDVVATLDSARQALGLDAARWAVVLAGLIGAFFPSIDRPGWWLTGPSGAGKTNRGRMLAGWVDPVKYLGGSLNLKRDERDARTRAMNGFIVSMDNLTTVTQDESDFWCGLHTGSAAQARKLHSDNTLLSFEYKRLGLGTSLNLPTGFKPDALRRMIHVSLAGTDDHPDLEKLWSKYDEIKPAVLGALYTVIAAILAHLDKAQAEKLSGCPEMSDFARRLKAADLAFGKLVRASEPGGEDLELYEAYRTHTVQILVDAGLENQLVLLLLKLMDGKKLNEPFTCSPATLLVELRQKAAGFDTSQPWFPASEKQLGHRMTDLYSVLARLGIDVKRGVRQSRYLPYVLTKVTEVTASDGKTAVGDSGDT